MTQTLNLNKLKQQLLDFKYIITDQTIVDLYPQLFSTQVLFPFVALEKNKNQESINQIHQFLFEHHVKRHEHILVIGGGITLDMAGFALATYMRGIPFTSVPSTLLAMVDVSHGGKVGINTPYGKNTLGTFYSPKNVLLCQELLDTLPWHETQNGLSEMLKHLIIAGEHHFPKPQTLTQQEAILQSINIKKKITQQDPYDLGIRQCLNLGHTLAHAAEIVSNHTLSHGQAVAWGLLIEGHILEEKKLARPYTTALNHYFDAHFELPAIPELPALWQAMQFDKKNTHTICISSLSDPYIQTTTYGMWEQAMQKIQSCQ
jgi:3-dehydroquinate synthetase